MATATIEPPPKTGGRLLTAEEYFALPPDGRKTELVDGEVVEVCVPTAWHGAVERNVTWHMENWCRRTKLGRIFTGDGGVKTTSDPDSVRGADVQYLSVDRLPLGGLPESGYPDVPPEVVFEIRSPNDSRRRMDDKAAEYLAAGVDVVVCLDRVAGEARLHRRGRDVEAVRVPDTLRIADALPGFEVPLADLFVEMN